MKAHMTKALLVGAIVALAVANQAQAGKVFRGNTPQGFVSALSGASEFGGTDASSSLTCPLCDSVVNFATYSNPDGGDWREALEADFGINPSSWQTLGSDQGAEGGDNGNPWDDRWVFFYQIQNTNPLGGVNADLENFNVTKTFVGNPFELNPYANGGFNTGAAIDPFNPTPGIDDPNDWVPAETGDRVVIPGVGGIDPSQLTFTNVSGPTPISSPSVRNGQDAYSGALFQFENFIGEDQFSEVLWLSSNARTAGIIWAETESPGGFGAAADIAGIKNIPEPTSLCSIFGLAVLGTALRRRK